MKIMGIDIGTTTVSIVLTDTETGKLLERETVEHNSFQQARAEDTGAGADL